MTIALRGILLSWAVIVGIGGVVLVALAAPRVPGATWTISEVPDADTTIRGDLGEVVLRVVAADLFRLERKPATLPFGVPEPVSAPAGAPARVAPIVSGMIGPPWKALVEGMPGRTGGVLVAAGDTVGSYRILRVSSSYVEIQAPDTLWRLTVRRTW